MFCSLIYIFMFCVNQLNSALSLLDFSRLLEHFKKTLMCTLRFQLIFIRLCLTTFELCLFWDRFISRVYSFVSFVCFSPCFICTHVLWSNGSLRPTKIIFVLLGFLFHLSSLYFWFTRNKYLCLRACLFKDSFRLIWFAWSVLKSLHLCDVILWNFYVVEAVW